MALPGDETDSSRSKLDRTQFSCSSCTCGSSHARLEYGDIKIVHQLQADLDLYIACVKQELAAEGRQGTSPASNQPRKHPWICMSSIDHSHIGTATDVRWLPSVTFSKDGATACEVTNSTAACGY